MYESARVQRTPSPSRQRRPAADQALFHVPLCASDAVRSARNIADWNSYLSTDCVRTMVRMGWDYTT